jgi:hypothetical protein
MPDTLEAVEFHDEAATLEALEEDLTTEEEPSQVPPSDIVAYNELRSCADLYRMQAQKILELQPDFQRDVVWKGSEQTRFIDSLTKQLPIPSMCFAMDYKAQRWIVIDGLQRISTIVKFLQGGDWTLSKLPDIDPGLAGKSVAAIKLDTGELHNYYTRVENLTIPVTVLRCDFTKQSHMNYLFMIFHRLNKEGVKLNNQEIRNCIYGGTFNTLLKELDKHPSWRRINKMQDDLNYRFTKQELMLRMFAFYDRPEKYEGSLVTFLNEYMNEYRNPGDGFLASKSNLLKRTADLIANRIFAPTVPPKLPITVLESVLVAVARNIDRLEASPQTDLSGKFGEMMQVNEFSDGALREGLAKKPRVAARLQTAERVFAGA